MFDVKGYCGAKKVGRILYLLLAACPEHCWQILIEAQASHQHVLITLTGAPAHYAYKLTGLGRGQAGCRDRRGSLRAQLRSHHRAQSDPRQGSRQTAPQHTGQCQVGVMHTSWGPCHSFSGMCAFDSHYTMISVRKYTTCWHDESCVPASEWRCKSHGTAPVMITGTLCEMSAHGVSQHNPPLS